MRLACNWWQRMTYSNSSLSPLMCRHGHFAVALSISNSQQELFHTPRFNCRASIHDRRPALNSQKTKFLGECGCPNILVAAHHCLHHQIKSGRWNLCKKHPYNTISKPSSPTLEWFIWILQMFVTLHHLAHYASNYQKRRNFDNQVVQKFENIQYTKAIVVPFHDQSVRAECYIPLYCYTLYNDILYTQISRLQWHIDLQHQFHTAMNNLYAYTYLEGWLQKWVKGWSLGLRKQQRKAV